jgi:hypothetical protein
VVLPTEAHQDRVHLQECAVHLDKGLLLECEGHHQVIQAVLLWVIQVVPQDKVHLAVLLQEWVVPQVKVHPVALLKAVLQADLQELVTCSATRTHFREANE